MCCESGIHRETEEVTTWMTIIGRRRDGSWGSEINGELVLLAW